MKNQKGMLMVLALASIGLGQGSAYTDAQHGFTATAPASWKHRAAIPARR